MSSGNYDSDDFDEEYLDEEANAYELTMSGIFVGNGDDPETARVSALDTAQENILSGEWELDEGKLVGENPYRYEFNAITVIEADSVEDAIDIAASELTDDWELIGDPEPLYLDD